MTTAGKLAMDIVSRIFGSVVVTSSLSLGPFAGVLGSSITPSDSEPL
jgi:hypothetical protein